MYQLQVEHRVWVAKKYPNQSPKVPAVGCLEEAGELVHAVLKIEQVQTWGEDTRHKLPELRLKLVDAVGDCGIYACSLCNANEWDFAEVWVYAVEMCANKSTLDGAIVLAMHAAQVALAPTDVSKLSLYVGQLKTVARSLGVDADTAIRVTWETVKCR